MSSRGPHHTSARAVLTTQRTLGPGAPLRKGTVAAYRPVVAMAGEDHVVREDLVGPSGALRPPARGAAIATFAHVTDLHVTDAESPARFEFVNEQWNDPRFRELLTMQRPHETLNTHAIDAMLQTIGAIASGPVAGGPVELLVMTGDAIDNTQRNELDNFLSLMNGGVVRPGSGASVYEGVQLPGWPGDVFWKPDGGGPSNAFTTGLAYPDIPGLLERAMQPFEAAGVAVPWLGCYGNHEEVCQGVGIVTPQLAHAMGGSRKPIALPDGLDRDRAVDVFVANPELFMTGRAVDVTPDSRRRPISRAELVELHCESGGHGFTSENRAAGTAYYVHDAGALRFITLDTVCQAGGADGWVEPEQLYWLERRLEEAHSSFRSRDGSVVRTRHDDRLVVLLTHHTSETLANPRAESGPGALLELLLRFPNVVLWLNGHIHANRIRPHANPDGAGFWEVTTSSIVDWPCQARLVELFDAGAGRLGIACTMVDHEGSELASIHRELAANVPGNGFDSWRPGAASDRNAILLVRAPFSLAG